MSCDWCCILSKSYTHVGACAMLIFGKEGRPLVKVTGNHRKYIHFYCWCFIVDDGKYRAPCAEKTAKGHAGDHTPAACTGGGLLYIYSVYCIDIVVVILVGLLIALMVIFLD